MKKQVSILTLLICDIFCIFLSLIFAVWIRNLLDIPNFSNVTQSYLTYIQFYFIYLVVIFSFIYNGIYTKRYDFWHENLLIFRSCIFACILVFSYLALNKSISHSRIVIILSFVLMAFLIPTSKFFLKKILYKAGFWQKKVKVINGTREFRREIFKNTYLGYKLTRGNDYETVFIQNRNNIALNELNTLVESNILTNKEVIFTPALKGYDYSNAEIFSLFNSRTNLFMLENSLLKPLNRITKRLFDISMIILAMPLLVPIFAIVIVAMKINEPRGSIFFSHPRMGRYGKAFGCLKFRSMRENCDEMFKKYLEENPQEIEYYQKYHKYENDIRITKLGNFLRKTSIDELPQLINVLKGDMSIVGPRPVLAKEFEMGDATVYERDIVLMVRPGVTGLAQINDREKSEFGDRVKMNIWYVKNWTLYMDFVIILKTIKLVLFRESAS